MYMNCGDALFLRALQNRMRKRALQQTGQYCYNIKTHVAKIGVENQELRNRRQVKNYRLFLMFLFNHAV